ncbi:alpha/beta fold hydrolase [Adhaeribacter rhizoryzae]|uniref:Alpha/beta hydrolase n=1 Tax=Adhaeribacter rhizoryzae TaxID=2607907 RepID=A0A5M6DBB9_9BACT|nr:alpha/beta hydrolase [Adhaeribacter rhizoryzae]KAA5544837.1 alpha/beta hydrolase [Adhaeribacter rhizoryzae]
MGLTKYSFLLLLIFSTLSEYVNAQHKPATEKPVYDAVLSQYNYPYPVKYLNLKVEDKEVRMAYMDVPPANKMVNAPVVMLLHGKNFFGAYWVQTIRFLTQNNFRVIVPDQVGFGKSSKTPLHYSFHQLAYNTKKLLDTLDIKKAAVVGHSMGGMLATRFALLYPETTAKLVLENPIGLEDYRRLVPYRTFSQTYQQELKTTEESTRKYHQTYYVSWQPAFDEWVQVPGAQTRSADYPTLALVSAQTYEMIYQQPVVYEFPDVKAPTLVIIGQEDRTVVGKALIKDKDVLAKAGHYPTLGKKTAAAIKNAKLIEMPKVGHIPHLEATEAFHKALLPFLK